MASTAYLLEYEEFVHGKKAHYRKLGAFTTMDKANAAAHAHIEWTATSEGRPGFYNELFESKTYSNALVWKKAPPGEKPNPTHPDYIYQVSKIRIR